MPAKNWDDAPEEKVASAPADGPESIVVFLAKNPAYVGDKVQATAEVRGKNGAAITDKTVTWSTSGFTELASVDADGLVTALGRGNAEITAQCDGKVGKLALTIG